MDRAALNRLPITAPTPPPMIVPASSIRPAR
jgi:hypothetical protein